MPILKQYSDNYRKDGYYVHAPIEGLSHPLPLQTPDITVRIYNELGYRPGDHVPNELTWKLYDVDLHWTENSGVDSASEGELKAAILGESGPDFTDKQAKTIISIVESYSGEYENELEALVDKLEPDTTESRSQRDSDGNENTPTVSVETLIKEFKTNSGISHFQESIDRELSDDEIQIVEEAATPDKIDTIDGTTFGAEEVSSKEEYFHRLAQCDNVLTSLAEFSSASSLELWRVVPIPPSIGYSYDTDTADDELYEKLQHLVVSDYRWNRDFDCDFIITVVKVGIGVRFRIRDEHISEFTVISEQDIGHLNRETIEQTTADEAEADQVMHHGLGTVIDAASLVGDLIGDIQSYRLCPVEPFSPA
jgi:hypothetical protein